MRVQELSRMTPALVRTAVNGFSKAYVADWDRWLEAGPKARPRLFGQTLRRWQATRPKASRRIRAEAQHEPPYLDDLIEWATEPLRELGDLSVLTVAVRTPQSEALNELWAIFSRLTVTGHASCVGITKAVMLLTDGRIGPAFDSNVQKKLGRPETPSAWVQLLQEVGEDIAAFETRNGPFAEAVSPEFAHIAYAWLYDMILGPR